MKRTTILLSLVVGVLIIAWITFNLVSKKSSNPGLVEGEQVSCTSLPDNCPGPNAIDPNGCPDYKSGTCTVTFDYYLKYGGCTKEHNAMTFFAHPKSGQASKYHLVAGTAGISIAAEFTEIGCTSHTAVGTIGAGKPFLKSGDDFSQFSPAHLSGDADPAMVGKCFKVTVKDTHGSCIDPHIIIEN